MAKGVGEARAMTQATGLLGLGRVERVAARLAWSLALLYGLIAGTALLLGPRNGGAFDDVSITLLFSFAGYAVVGGLLSTRRPRNPIGWLMLGMSLSGATTVLADQWSIYGLITAPGSLPAPELAGWVALWLAPIAGLINIFLLFVFPSGHLPSSRWRPVVSTVAIVAAGVTLLTAFGSPGSQAHPEIVNPFHLSQLRPAFDLLYPASWLSIGLFVLAVASLVARYRRALQAERQQLKWIVLAGLFTAVIAVGGAALEGPVIQTPALLGVALLALPAGIGIAILRHRLFDIDLLIKRTVVYGATTTAIAAVFFAGILATQALLRPVTGGSELAIAASTLVSFALFQPMRRWLQDLVDRRFDHSRYDAARALDAFADQLRDEVDLDTLRDDLLGAVRQTMAPSHASFWLRERSR